MKTGKTILTLALLSLLVTLLAACGAAAPAPSPTATPTIIEAAPTPTEEFAPSGDDAWEEYTSEEGRFSILAPGEATENTQMTNTALGEITTHLTSFESIGPEYAVAYADYPATGQIDEAELMEDTMQGAAQGGVIAESQMITVQGNPGIQGEIESADGQNYIWYKAVLVENRLYQVLVVTSMAAKDQFEGDAMRFLDSFTLLDQ